MHGVFRRTFRRPQRRVVITAPATPSVPSYTLPVAKMIIERTWKLLRQREGVRQASVKPIPKIPLDAPVHVQLIAKVVSIRRSEERISSKALISVASGIRRTETQEVSIS